MIQSPASRVVVALLLAAGGAFAALLLRAGWPVAVAILATAVATAIFVGSRRPASIAALPAPPPVDLTADARLLEAISEPVLIAVDGRVRVANTAARNLLGAHAVGEDVRLAIRHPAAAERLAADAPDGGVELVGLGGRDQRIEMQVATLATGRRLIHLIDRTTRYLAERARVDFVANASHELRTPLSAILGFIETLDDENAGGDPEVRRRFLSVMFEEARRMERLIEDLISLSRIESEKYVLPGTTVALDALIEEVASEVRDTDGAARADLVLAVESDVPLVTGDHTQLSQVLHNLIGNAFKYGRSGAPVTVSLRHEGNLIRASVADQGEGIAPEHLPRLTERFYRVDSGRSRAMGGTGLGLAIVKHIVERHRGRLEIQSEVGRGTTVSITLPAAMGTAVTDTSSI